MTVAEVRPGTRVSKEEWEGLDLSNRPLYERARLAAAPVWSNTVLSPLTGHITAVVAAPCDGRLVVADLSLDRMAQQIRMAGDLRDVAVIMFDGPGRVIVHPDQQRANWQENLSQVDLVHKALNGYTGPGQIELDGRHWLATVAPAATTGWYMLVTQPRSRAAAQRAVRAGQAARRRRGHRGAGRPGHRHRDRAEARASPGRRLIERMGGEIAVDSRPDVGTRVTLALRRARDVPLLAPGDAAAHLGLPHGAGGQVVYVEDNPINALLMQDVIAQRPDCALHLAVSVCDGIDMIARLRPDLVLVDLHLPDGSGLQVTEWMRANPLLARVPVVVVSADSTQVQRDAAAVAGVRVYLAKPIRLAETLLLIDELLPAAK